MAKFDADGNRIPTSLFEAAAWHQAIVANCRRCKREEVFDPHALWWLFHRRHWDDRLHSVARRLKCKTCKAGAFLSLSRDKPETMHLELPPALVWKQEINRFRS